MVGNDLRYAGRFPVSLEGSDAVSDDKGNVALNLPAADKPSRYLLTVSASDGAAYRVTTTKEILIERGLAHYSLSTSAQYSNSGESVVFRYAALESSKQVPVKYEWLRPKTEQATAEIYLLVANPLPSISINRVTTI